MKINYIKVSILGILAVLLVGVTINGNNNDTSSQKDVEFNVKAIQSKKQIDKSKTYFHLLAKPGSKQRVEFDVSNITKKDLEVKAKVSTALTNKNGVIIYDGGNNNEKVSKTIKVKAQEIVKLDSEVINIKANQSKKVGATITMPNKKIDGIVLGGFNFSLVDSKESKVESGIQSKYQYNIALILSQTNTSKLLSSDKLELSDINTKVSDGSKVTIFDFENTKEHTVSNLKLDFNISKENTKKNVLSHSDTQLNIAPNSIMSYNLDWGIKDLTPGIYTANIKGKTKEKNWTWTKKFEITDNQAKKLNKEAINKLYYPSWFKYTVVILSVVTVIAMILVFKGNRKLKEV